jgi:hypothetical protein
MYPIIGSGDILNVDISSKTLLKTLITICGYLYLDIASNLLFFLLS